MKDLTIGTYDTRYRSLKEWKTSLIFSNTYETDVFTKALMFHVKNHSLAKNI